MGWANDAIEELTIPSGAGENEARTVITSTLPPPLDTYVTPSGPYSDAIISYSDGDDTTYFFEANVNIAGGVEKHFGTVQAGVVAEQSPGVPHGLRIVNAGAVTVSLSGDQVNIGSLSGTTSIYGIAIGLTGDVTLSDSVDWAGSTTVTSEDATARTTASLTYTAVLAPAGICGVAFVAPPSGKVLVTVGVDSDNSGASYSITSPQIRTGGTVGAGVLFAGWTANDDRSVFTQNVDQVNCGRQWQASGLTPGSTYNVQLLHRVLGGTGTFARRNVIVTPAL